MIPVSQLKRVQKIVVHGQEDGACPDGLGSAIIIQDVLPNVEIVFADHRNFKMVPEPNVMFCDFTPKQDLEVWRKLGTIVLDHHKTAESIVKSFEYNAFGDEKMDPGVSGAVLAFRHVWLPLCDAAAATVTDLSEVSKFATLVGIRDTYVRSDPRFEEASALSEALTFYPIEDWLGVKDREGKLVPVFPLQRPLLMMDRWQVGSIAYQTKLKSARKSGESADIYTTQTGLKVAIAGAYYSTDIADVLGASVDAVIAFSYGKVNDRIVLRVSCRSRGSLDVGKLCQKVGGGGHSQAAAGTLTGQVDVKSPFQLIKEWLDSST